MSLQGWGRRRIRGIGWRGGRGLRESRGRSERTKDMKANLITLAVVLAAVVWLVLHANLVEWDAVKVAGAVLAGVGYEVIKAANGREALKAARAGQVDVVITDLVMPEQEGIETIQALRKDDAGIGIIAI